MQKQTDHKDDETRDTSKKEFNKIIGNLIRTKRFIYSYQLPHTIKPQEAEKKSNTTAKFFGKKYPVNQKTEQQKPHPYKYQRINTLVF